MRNRIIHHQKVKTLLGIGQLVASRTRNLIQYSANLNNTSSSPHRFTGTSSSTYNRLISLSIVRGSAGNKPHPSQFSTLEEYETHYKQWWARKQLRKEIKQWNLPIFSNHNIIPADEEFLIKSLENRYATLPEIAQLLDMLSEKFPKTRSSLRQVESDALKAFKLNIGNCGELSCYAFLLLLEYPKEGVPEYGLPPLDKKISVELIKIPNAPDHQFLIINRNPETNLNDISTWNLDTIFVDAWTEECCTLQELLNSPNNYLFEQLIKVSQRSSEFIPTAITKKYAYYIGENHNDIPIHTSKWKQKNAPSRLFDIRRRPIEVKKIPPHRSRGNGEATKEGLLKIATISQPQAQEKPKASKLTLPPSFTSQLEEVFSRWIGQEALSQFLPLPKQQPRYQLDWLKLFPSNSELQPLPVSKRSHADTNRGNKPQDTQPKRHRSH